MWETARRAKPGFRAANLCWWYAMGASTDLTVTPRPIYHADGRKSPDATRFRRSCTTTSPARSATSRCFSTGARRRSIKSTKWIADAAKIVLDNEQLDMLLVYLPHLDYDHQRFGPERPGGGQGGARSSTRSLGDLIDHARGRGDQVVVLSEYGITAGQRPVEINRALRRAGLLNVYTQAGMEYLDPWTSRAFAVADHQIAHVYVPNPADLPAAARGDRRARRRGGDPRGRIAGRRRPGPRALRRARRPGRARRLVHLPLLARQRPRPGLRPQVEIHRKPGYDPAELFMDPDDEKGAKLRAGLALARKKTGFRYVMSVVGLDASKYVKGTHGLLPDDRRGRAGVPVQRGFGRSRTDRRHRRARPAARAERRRRAVRD